jgi:hypothetical protein
MSSVKILLHSSMAIKAHKGRKKDIKSGTREDF